MISTLIIIYFIVLLIPIFKRNGNWFVPPILMSITMAFYTVPDLLGILIGGHEKYIASIGCHLNNTSNILIERFVFLQIVYIGCYFLSYYYLIGKKYKIKTIPFKIKKQNPKITQLMACVLIGLCLYSTISYIYSKGGIIALFMSFTNRSELNDDLPFLQRLMPTIMTFATAFCMKVILSDKKPHIILLLTLLVTGFLCYTSNGGRSQLVVFILSLMCYYNYWRKEINLLSPKFYPIYGLLVIFIISFQLLRFKETQSFSIEDIFNSSDTLFDSMAYVKTQLLIQNYFDKFEYWYGWLFSFVPFIFIPRTVYPLKPNIDEGTYIFNMKNNAPNVLDDINWVNSWPPFTMGTGYANFGIIGVILFAFILAYIHMYMYRLLKASKAGLFIMPIYIYIILKFQVTIFYIANLTYLLISTYLMYRLYRLLSKVKITNPLCPNFFK